MDVYFIIDSGGCEKFSIFFLCLCVGGWMNEWDEYTEMFFRIWFINEGIKKKKEIVCLIL